MTMRFRTIGLSVLSLGLLWFANLAFTDDSDDDARKTAERYLLVLERNPRKGTALDKVLEFHAERGTLEELASQRREKAQSASDTKNFETARAWIVVGLIEDSRGETEAAVDAFERAEQNLANEAERSPTSPKKPGSSNSTNVASLAAFYLGQSLVTLSRYEDAAAALERAIERQPAPTDLLDIFQTLGRVQQRVAPGDKVVEVWTRLEKLVPNDPRVPELIARTLLDDGHLEAALPRFESLAKNSKDPYRRSELELESIDIRLKLGQTERALNDADKLLAALKPDHWLFRETRQRIEQAFLSKDDPTGLAKHYEERLTRQPGDFDAVVRLSRTLATQGEMKDARSRLEAAIQLAPKSAELRLELIGLLEQEQLFADAVTQYEALNLIEPNHPDHIRDWGFAVLKLVVPPSGDQTSEEEDRLKAERRTKKAAAIWRKLVDAKPKDAVVATQVAGLMRQAGLLADAEGLLRKAVELAPDVLSHREELGEVLDAQKKKPESLVAWRSMAEEPRRNASNLAAVADVLARHGYRDESLQAIDEACELDRKSLELRFQQIDIRKQWRQNEAAREAITAAYELADTPETFDRVVQREIDILLAAELLTTAIEELREVLSHLKTPSTNQKRERGTEASEPSLVRRTSESVGPHSPAAQWFRFARLLEAAAQPKEATLAAQKSAELAPRTGLYLQTAARMLAQDNQWQPAIELHEKLIGVDRRFRVDSLRAIAELEMKLGRKDRALKAGRDLLAAAPGAPDQADFVVDVFLRFELKAEALHVLRRTSRQNPADKRLALRLTELLLAMPVSTNGGRQPSGQSNTVEEARDVLWRVFEQSAKLEDRIEVVRKLSELAAFPSELEKLTQRLQRLRQEPKLSRDATLCLVQVHEQAGDSSAARRELERLLPQTPRDIELLKRLSLLCEASGDIDAAIAHQRRLVDLSVAQVSSLSRSGSEPQAGSSNHEDRLIALLRKAGRATEAETLATRWLESERDPAKVLREIDRLLGIEKGKEKNRPNAQRALALAQVWLDREPDHWEFLLREGFALIDVGQTKEANAVFDKMLALPVSDDTLSVLSSRPNVGSSSTARIAERVHQLRQRLRFHSETYDYGAARVRVLWHRQYESVVPNVARDAAKNAKLNDAPGTGGLTPPARQVSKEVAFRQCYDAVCRNQFLEARESLVKSAMQLLDVASDDPGAQWFALKSLAIAQHHFSESPLKPADDSTKPSLDGAVVDRAVAALRRLWLCDEAMEWSELPLIELVCRELARNRQDDKLKELLAEFASVTKSPDGFGWLIQRTCRDGDVDAALRLLPMYAASFESRLRMSPSGATTLLPSDPSLVAWWLQHLIWRQLGADLSEQVPDQQVLSEAKKENVLRIVSAALTVFSDSRLPKPSSTFAATMTAAWQADKRASLSNALLASARQAGTTGFGLEMSLFWTARNHLGRTTLPFPYSIQTPERCALAVLLQASLLGGHSDTRKAELVVGSTDWQSELREHVAGLRKRLEAGSNEAHLAELCHTSLLVWQGKSAEAMSAMKQLFENATHQPSLQLEIVSYFLKDNQHELALNLLDRITTTDQNLIKEIELRALDLAAKLKNTERAKEAAERLFGVKLEPAQELALAKQLSELGLREQSQALLMRAPQRHSNDLGLLQQVMEQHVSHKDVDEACQVAEQIVRRTQPLATARMLSGNASARSGQTGARVGAVSEVARLKALGVLASLGRLQPIIEQTERQLESSPHSLRAVSQLLELYSVTATIAVEAGDAAVAKQGEKRKALLTRLSKSDAADPQFRLFVARTLVGDGQAKDAVSHYLFVLEKSPTADAGLLLEAEAIIQELGSADELAHVVLRSKFATNDQQRLELFSRLVLRLEGPPIRANLIIELFQKAWRESPDFRPQLAARLLLVSESVWQQEAMWDVARNAVLPATDRQSVSTWSGVDVVRVHSGHQIDGLMFQLLELATREKKLDELARDVTAALEKHPGWSGGRLLLGMIRLRQGNVESASSVLTKLLDESTTLPMLLALRTGFEVARNRELTDLALRFYESTMSSPMTLDTRRIVLDHCRVYGTRPQFQQMATDVLLSLTPNANVVQDTQSLSNLISEIAAIAKDLNQPYIAARLAQTLKARVVAREASTDGMSWLKQIEERFSQASLAIKPDMLPLIFRLAARERAPRGDSRQRLDLLLQVTGESVAEMTLHSPILANLKFAASDDKLWPQIMEPLTKLREQFPNDASIEIAAAFAELVRTDGPRDEKLASRLRELLQLLQPTSRRTGGVSPLVENGQSAFIALWLLARECSAHRPLHDVSMELTKAATEGARRQRDPRFLWALLREQGQLALQVNKRDESLLLWTELVRESLRDRKPDEWEPMLVNGSIVIGGDTVDLRLMRAHDLARMTLDASFTDLSLQAFRNTVVALSQPNDPSISFVGFDSKKENQGSGRIIFNSTSHLKDFMSGPVLAVWDDLEPQWRAKSVSTDAIFATLVECVLPAEQRSEVNVFALPLERSKFVVPPSGGPADKSLTDKKQTTAPTDRLKAELRTTESLGLRLVERAVAESRVDELKKRLASREVKKESDFALRLLWLELALATRDESLFEEHFKALESYTALPEGWPWIAHEGRVAAHIIRLLSQQTSDSERIAKLFASLLTAQPKEFSRSEFPAADLRRWLAKHHLAQGQVDQGRDVIAAHLRHMEGVWSAAGAMDGQHLRRTELLELANGYATVGLQRESLELLGQAADARWPDKYAAENPGAVLSALQSTLQSRPAAERYLLWRNWSLPDVSGSNARSQMRLLSGSTGRTDPESANAKTDSSPWVSTAQLLIDTAREANRLDELKSFVTNEGTKRYDARVNVLLALIHLAEDDVTSAAPLLQKVLATGDSPAVKPGSALRTQAWDDALLSLVSARHEQLKPLANSLSQRALAGARELKDVELLKLLGEKN